MLPNPPLTSILLWILFPNGNEISYTGNICNIGQLRNKPVVYYLLSFSKFSFKVHISLKTVTGFRRKDDIPWSDIQDRGGTVKQVNGLFNVRSTGRVESTLNLGTCLQITPSMTIQGIVVRVKKLTLPEPDVDPICCLRSYVWRLHPPPQPPLPAERSTRISNAPQLLRLQKKLFQPSFCFVSTIILSLPNR